MIKSVLSGAISPKTVRFSGFQFCFGVVALHNAAGVLLLGVKTFQHQRSVPAKHLGHFLHRLNLRSHSLGAPFFQKLAGPEGRDIRPEQLKLFLQKLGSDRLQIVS